MSYIILSGGFIIWPIILLSIISLAIVIEKTWNLARDAVLPKDLTKDVISQIEKKSLTNSMKEKMASDSVQGTIFFGLMEERLKSKTNLRLRAEEIGRFEINRLEKFMTLLGTIASVSPILGLLGTVTGMISIFSNLLVSGTNSIGPLAGGIAEALITTAAGLIVAIPSLIFYRSFNRTIENYSLELEEESNKLINELRKKLAKKQFEIAKQYHKTENYKSAVIALNNALIDYPNYDERDEILYIILESNYLLAINSVSSKKEERLKETLMSYQMFADNYSESSRLEEATKIKESTQKQLKLIKK